MFHQRIFVLFHQRSTFSYVYDYFFGGFDKMYDNMSVPIQVSTLIGDPLVVD